MVLALLNKWGHKGFMEHTTRVSAFYKAQCEMFEKIAHEYLDGIATWVSPEAGMFLYLALDLPAPGDSQALIATKAVEKGVLAIPGVAFMPSGSRSNYVRVSFSLAEEAETREAFKRLREVVLETRAEGGL